jgi:hypothetical protein
MTKAMFEVQFSGRVTVVFDTDDYPHYFEAGEIRGGKLQLAEDVFYDNATLRGANFEEGSDVFDDVYLTELDPTDYSVLDSKSTNT